MRGSYTIESAFVMSIGLFALLSLLFLAFYLQDIQCLLAGMNETADRAAAEGWSEAELEEALKQEEGERRLFFLRRKETELSGVSGWRQGIYFPIPFYAKLFFQDTIRDGFVPVQVNHFCPERFIRQTEAVKEVIE